MIGVQNRIDSKTGTDGVRADGIAVGNFVNGAGIFGGEHVPWAIIFLERLFDANATAAETGDGAVALKLMSAG